MFGERQKNKVKDEKKQSKKQRKKPCRLRFSNGFQIVTGIQSRPTPTNFTMYNIHY